jgi:hypothetical protein
MSIFVYSYQRHHIQRFPRPWRKRPDEARSIARLQNERFVFTDLNGGWQELIFSILRTRIAPFRTDGKYNGEQEILTFVLDPRSPGHSPPAAMPLDFSGFSLSAI